MGSAAPDHSDPTPASAASLSAGWVGEMPIGVLRAHPLGALIPVMSPQERDALVKDVRARGILAPLEVNAQGVVLDGRHRLEVAQQLGMREVPVRVVAPVDEVQYMVQAALARRHLSASQRGALAIDLEALQRDRLSARARQRANLRQFAEVATLPPRGERTRETAARWAGVSPRVVQDALTVRDADPALYERVRSGEIPAHTAARRVRRARLHAAIPPGATAADRAVPGDSRRPAVADGKPRQRLIPRSPLPDDESGGDQGG